MTPLMALVHELSRLSRDEFPTVRRMPAVERWLIACEINERKPDIHRAPPFSLDDCRTMPVLVRGVVIEIEAE